jgi:hypothetical protein
MVVWCYFKKVGIFYMLRNCFWHKYYEIKEQDVIQNPEMSESSIVTDDSETIDKKMRELYYIKRSDERVF